jgi:hypothetical protein
MYGREKICTKCGLPKEDCEYTWSIRGIKKLLSCNPCRFMNNVWFRQNGNIILDMLCYLRYYGRHRKKTMRIISLLALFLLSACTAHPLTPTTTPTSPIPSSTPLPTGTSTVTPTATLVPLPETEAVKALQEAYTAEGKGYQVGWNQEGTGLAIIWVNPENPEEKKIVPEIVINPKDGSAVRTYFCETEESGKFEVTTNYTTEEIKTRTFSEWEIKEGILVKETNKFTGLVKPEEGPTLELYSLDEINAELALSSAIATDEERGVPRSAPTRMLEELFGRVVKENRVYFTYEKMLIQAYGTYYFGDNQIEIQNSQSDITQTVNVPFYIVRSVGDNGQFAFIGWKAGGKNYTRITNKDNLNIPKNFNSIFTKRAPKG